jgi:GT2 family glycosyltransferase
MSDTRGAARRGPAHGSVALDVSISLVAVNQRHDLERLLPTLVRAIEGLRCEVLLVDNRSTDGAREFVRAAYPFVKVHWNPRRTGYGENHNLNLARASGRYFVIMNSDMTVEPDVFRGLVQFMDQNRAAGIACPKILNEDGTVQGLNKRYPTLWDLILRRFMPKRWLSVFQQRLNYYEMRDIGYESTYDVPNISGAFMFCRTSVLRQVGGFDGRYFLYFEDTDLCRRVQPTHRTLYYPGVAVTHYWERRAHKRWIYTYYFCRSAFRYFNRWGYALW